VFWDATSIFNFGPPGNPGRGTITRITIPPIDLWFNDEMTHSLEQTLRSNPYWPVDSGESLKGWYVFRQNSQTAVRFRGREGQIQVGNHQFYAAFIEELRNPRFWPFRPAATWVREELPAFARRAEETIATIFNDKQYFRGRGGSGRRDRFTKTGRLRAETTRQRTIRENRVRGNETPAARRQFRRNSIRRVVR